MRLATACVEAGDAQQPKLLAVVTFRCDLRQPTVEGRQPRAMIRGLLHRVPMSLTTVLLLAGPTSKGALHHYVSTHVCA